MAYDLFRAASSCQPTRPTVHVVWNPDEEATGGRQSVHSLHLPQVHFSTHHRPLSQTGNTQPLNPFASVLISPLPFPPRFSPSLRPCRQLRRTMTAFTDQDPFPTPFPPVGDATGQTHKDRPTQPTVSPLSADESPPCGDGSHRNHRSPPVMPNENEWFWLARRTEIQHHRQSERAGW